MVDLRIPTELLPLDGRFGCGPSIVRPAQIDFLVSRSATVLGTSHRQPGVKNTVERVREGLATFFKLPDGYEIIFSLGGSTAFWDAAAFGLIEKRAQASAFGEFGAKFAKVAAAPWLEAPDVREAPAGSVALPEPVAGVDLYAWPQNETSTGAMAPVKRVAGDAGALTMIDATSAAGGAPIDIAETDVYYFAPQKNFGSDGGLWFAAVSPAAIERIERIGASERYIPEFLKLTHALTNSRQNQTLNTPAISTLLLLESQVEWLNENGGLDWATARTAESSRTMYEWAEASSYASPFVQEPEYRSQVVATIDFDDSVDAKRVAQVLRDNWIIDTEPYRKLGRNQLRIATFVGIDPHDIERLTRAIDYVVERI